jgi:glycosyltransferase involved in cell wall biosynthesis
MRIAWLSYLDPFSLHGGGELSNRTIIEVGRQRGHEIVVSAWLRERPQRAMRRLGIHRRVKVNWDAELFLLADIHNCPQRRDRFPDGVVDRALATGRAVLMAQAWVDVCPFDMPCGGNPACCRPGCDRTWANRAYAAARVAVFISPMQHRMIEAVLDHALPSVIYSRPQIDVQRFTLGHQNRDIDVLYVGTIHRRKGYYNLLARFGSERMTFAGPNHLGQPVAGSYLGPVAYDLVPDLYRRARVFAHLPEWYEPMGRTVVEAAMCGCQIVTNDRVGVESYPREDWTNRERVATNADRFWRELEAAVSDDRRPTISTP